MLFNQYVRRDVNRNADCYQLSVVVLYVLSVRRKNIHIFTCFRIWFYSLFVAYSLLMKSFPKSSNSVYFATENLHLFSLLLLFFFYQALMFVELLHNNTKYSTSHKINPSNEMLCFIHWKRIQHSQPLKISISQSFYFFFLISFRFISFHFSVLNRIWRTLWPVRASQSQCLLLYKKR